MVKRLGHPVLVHKLNRIRDLSTEKELIAKLLEEIASFMVYEVLSDIKLKKKEVDIWVGKGVFDFIDEEEVVFISVLRAGLPMLEGALKVLPNAKVGFLGLKRDEETLKSKVYYSRLPEIKGKRVLILDPMLATGGTLERAIGEVSKNEPGETLSVHIVSAPEGIERISKAYPNHRLFTVSVDERLNPKGYIIPGLGDMGDRLYS